MTHLNKALALVLLLFTTTLSAQKWVDYMNDPTKTLLEIQKEAEKYFKVHGTGKGTGYKQYKRWEYEQLLTVDRTNGMRQDARKIWKETFKFKAAQRKITRGAAPSSPEDDGEWTELGPTYWDRTTGWNPGVGRITSIAVDPNNNQVIYISSPGGGVWKSIDGGSTWTPLTDNLPVNVVYSVAVDPSNSNVVYMGTSAGGVLKSTDAGLNWTQVLNLSGTQRKILVHPSNSNIVFVAGSNGVHKTTNGGTSWTQVLSTGMNDIDFKPGDVNTVYTCGNSFYKSTDGGNTFSLVSLESTGRSFLAVTPADPSRVYVVQARGSEFGRFYRSTDSGNSFTTTIVGNASNGTNFFGYQSNGQGTGGQAWYDMAITASNTNADEVHIAGIICWKSTNGGNSFVATTEWYLPNSRGYNHADVHALEYVGNTIFSGSDGGIYKSDNQAGDWTDLSPGLGIRQFYRIGVSKADPTRVSGGAQDNGTSIYKDGLWKDWLGADGMESYFDATNPDLVYGTIQNGGMYRSENGGASNIGITEPGSNGNWITPAAADPTVSQTIYVGFTRLYKSINKGGSWTQISTMSTGNIDYFAIAESNNQVIYVVDGNNVYKTTNGGGSWTNVSDSYSGGINGISIDPNNENRVAVVTSSGKVYESENGGSSWTNISANLPSLTGYTIGYSNNAVNGLYVGMAIGVYYIDDNLTSWVEFSDKLPNVAVRDIEINDAAGKIWVATYGRGLWVSPLRPAGQVTNQPPVVNITSPANASTFTGLNAIAFTATAVDNDGTVASAKYTIDGTDYPVTSPFNLNWTPTAIGTYSVTFEATDDDGASSSTSISITVEDENVGGCTDPAWEATGVYTGGTKVSHNGKVYQANWWTQGDDPETNSGQWQVWTYVEDCAVGNQAPTATIDSPISGSNFKGLNPIAISVTANDADGSVAKVTFSIEGTDYDVTTGNPYVHNWTPTSYGTFVIAVKATDNEGAESDEVSITVNVNPNQVPSISWLEPANNATIENLVATNFKVQANDLDGSVSKVTFTFPDGSVDVTTPDGGTTDEYSTSWTPSSYGVKNITAVAYDDDNAVSATANLSVEYVEPDLNVAPEVSITTPTVGQVFVGLNAITLSANATDADGSVANVRFTVDGTNIDVTSGNPYTTSWTPSSYGNYTVQAVATDNEGKLSTIASVSFVVEAPNQDPTISITSPADGATIYGLDPISIEVNAQDVDGTITQVEYAIGTFVHTEFTSPFTYQFTPPAYGTYTIIAQATDDDGAKSNGATITITVEESTGGCTEPQYVAGTVYATGDDVQNLNNVYNCLVGGWCSSSAAWAYEPGAGLYWSSAWSLVGPCPTTSSSAQYKVSALPNPTTGNFQLSVEAPEALGTVTLELLNATNTVIETRTISTNLSKGSSNFDLSTYAKGIYQVRVSSGQGVSYVSVVHN